MITIKILPLFGRQAPISSWYSSTFHNHLQSIPPSLNLSIVSRTFLPWTNAAIQLSVGWIYNDDFFLRMIQEWFYIVIFRKRFFKNQLIFQHAPFCISLLCPCLEHPFLNETSIYGKFLRCFLQLVYGICGTVRLMLLIQ